MSHHSARKCLSLMRTLTLVMVVVCGCGTAPMPEVDAGQRDAGPPVVDAGPDDGMIRVSVNGLTDVTTFAQYGVMDGGSLRVHAFGFNDANCPDLMSIEPRMHVYIEGLPASSDGGVLTEADGVTASFFEASGSLAPWVTVVNDVRLAPVTGGGDSLGLRWRVTGVFTKPQAPGSAAREGTVAGHFQIGSRCSSLDH